MILKNKSEYWLDIMDDIYFSINVRSDYLIKNQFQ